MRTLLTFAEIGVDKGDTSLEPRPVPGMDEEYCICSIMRTWQYASVTGLPQKGLKMLRFTAVHDAHTIRYQNLDALAARRPGIAL